MTVKITVFFDGVPYLVSQGRNLLEAALDSGLDLPYFCWHPVMRSIGRAICLEANRSTSRATLARIAPIRIICHIADVAAALICFIGMRRFTDQGVVV